MKLLASIIGAAFVAYIIWSAGIVPVILIGFTFAVLIGWGSRGQQY